MKCYNNNRRKRTRQNYSQPVVKSYVSTAFLVATCYFSTLVHTDFVLTSAFVVTKVTRRNIRILGKHSNSRAPQQTTVARENNALGDTKEIDGKKVTTSSSSSSGADFSFFDEAIIYVRAGSGGQGSSTYKKAKKGQNGIPDGGSGGKGGNVVLVLDDSLNTLAGLSKKTLRPNAFGGGGAAASSKRVGHQKGGNAVANNRGQLLSFRAEDGWAGGRMYDNGRGGEDCEVLVPPGTVASIEVPKVRIGDNENDNQTAEETADNEGKNPSTEESEDSDIIEIGTITHENPKLTVAKGGEGGEGTATLKGKKKGATRRGPQGGERHNVHLTLKIVADVALVGVPNAGKSTFLAAVTRAKPRIADYPFTTVVPNLGTWIPPEDYNNENRDGSSRGRQGREKNSRAAGSTGLVLCDVPGLIAGASEGVGLGHAFLRHIERCRVILHLIDATSNDPVGDFNMVNDELRRYGSGSLATMPQVVVVNKIDKAWDEEVNENEVEKKKLKFAEELKEAMGHTRLMWASAKERRGVDDLMARMSSYVGKVKEQQAESKSHQS